LLRGKITVLSAAGTTAHIDHHRLPGRGRGPTGRGLSYRGGTTAPLRGPNGGGAGKKKRNECHR